LLRDTTQLAVMTHSYHAPLVILSVIVAIFASFAALELAGRVRSESALSGSIFPAAFPASSYRGTT
jgi:NO-binding membrane sensor protein with MHYT domain